ncbi:putative type 1 pili major subunit [Acinetobacter guillouiae]|uniref:fimbrial protein n=1 Tax=Acinetobacter guillouiae TaxID=106649 RepID=UPI0004EF5EB1|nr:fimbrial protein [Acinetobacter guillouiae]BAP36415.1 putative type 1 pili major subunit [Acinetobacter guillouiae]BAP36418.1 putative type 1 pili major subunit [Acinetobacter guillouiae]
MKKLSLGLATLVLSATSTVFAATGTINFSGSLVGETCDAGMEGGEAAGNVTMPQVNITSLATAGTTAGVTPFKINLKGAGCVDQAKTATPYFEYEVAKINALGRLINDAEADAATNVEIQVLNDSQKVIDLTASAATQTTSVGVPVGAAPDNSNDFNYYARYFSTGVAGEGKVNASLSYNIFYK